MTTTLITNRFPGYNLRGLIFAYLEDHGWTWDGEAWRNGQVGFVGEDASDEAVRWQIEVEERRAA